VQAAFRPAGSGWGAVADLGSVAGRSQVRVAIDGAGNAVAVWRRADGSLRAVGRKRSTGNWTQPTTIAANVTAAGARLAINPVGNAVAIWTNAVDGITRAALRPAASGVWRPPVRISRPGSSDARIAMDAASNAVATWNRVAAPSVVVESADLSGRGPLLAGLQIPKKAIVGLKSAFSIRPAAWAAPLVGFPSWRFGDGASATGLRVTHTYGAARAYIVTVTQSDTAGGVSMSTRRISVTSLSLVNIVRPKIQGEPRLGNTLTCKRGSWISKTPVQYTFKWLRAEIAISGATARLYKARSADVGSLVSCRVKAANSTRSVTLKSSALRVTG
jgi:hypothetical protein